VLADQRFCPCHMRTPDLVDFPATRPVQGTLVGVVNALRSGTSPEFFWMIGPCCLLDVFRWSQERRVGKRWLFPHLHSFSHYMPWS